MHACYSIMAGPLQVITAPTLPRRRRRRGPGPSQTHTIKRINGSRITRRPAHYRLPHRGLSRRDEAMRAAQPPFTRPPRRDTLIPASSASLEHPSQSQKKTIRCDFFLSAFPPLFFTLAVPCSMCVLGFFCGPHAHVPWRGSENRRRACQVRFF